MAWKIRRVNNEAGTSVVAPQTYPDAETAFRAAMSNVVSYITNHWDSGTGAGDQGPGNNHRFKIYIDRRTGQARVVLRYDHPSGTDAETNDIVWQVANL